jgi:MFS family permease
MLTPFALSMMIVAPVSGWLSDRYEPRILSGVGLLISAAGLIGFMFITPGMSLIQLSVWMCIMGFGSGMFFSPNTNAIMRAVPVERRGIAAGIRTMMNNAGNVISIGLAMAIISTSIDPHALQGLFAGTQVGSAGIAVGEFISGLRVVFTISFIFSLTAAGISFLKGPQPVWDSEPEVISTEAHCIQE